MFLYTATTTPVVIRNSVKKKKPREHDMGSIMCCKCF